MKNSDIGPHIEIPPAELDSVVKFTDWLVKGGRMPARKDSDVMLVAAEPDSHYPVTTWIAVVLWGGDNNVFDGTAVPGGLAYGKYSPRDPSAGWTIPVWSDDALSFYDGDVWDSMRKNPRRSGDDTMSVHYLRQVSQFVRSGKAGDVDAEVDTLIIEATSNGRPFSSTGPATSISSEVWGRIVAIEPAYGGRRTYFFVEGARSIGDARAAGGKPIWSYGTFAVWPIDGWKIEEEWVEEDEEEATASDGIFKEIRYDCQLSLLGRQARLAQLAYTLGVDEASVLAETDASDANQLFDDRRTEYTHFRDARDAMIVAAHLSYTALVRSGLNEEEAALRATEKNNGWWIGSRNVRTGGYGYFLGGDVGGRDEIDDLFNEIRRQWISGARVRDELMSGLRREGYTERQAISLIGAKSFTHLGSDPRSNFDKFSDRRRSKIQQTHKAYLAIDEPVLTSVDLARNRENTYGWRISDEEIQTGTPSTSS